MKQSTPFLKKLHRIVLDVKGMTCAGCEAHIEYEVNQLDGILEVDANYETSSALVKYDKGKVTPDEIATAIGKTGYKIIE